MTNHFNDTDDTQHDASSLPTYIEASAAQTTSSSTATGQSPNDSRRSDTSQSISRKIQKDIKYHPDLEKIILEHEISRTMANHLSVLQTFEIVIVCDDSGSMNEPIWGNGKTRWDVLQEIVNLVLKVAVFFDKRGVDIHFLNRDPCPRVKDVKEVQSIFSEKPSGYTPLVPVLERIFQSKATRQGHDKKLLVLIATDGAPTDDEGEETIAQLEELMNTKRNAERTFVQFLACTDDQSALDYLTEWDRTMKNVDVIRDFPREKKRIVEKCKKIRRFTMGDYIVKALVGPIVPEIDSLNDLSGPFS